MLSLLFVLTSLMISACYEVEEGLITVVAIYRHGDRTPIKTYPTDPYQNASFWQVGFGQLTNIGKMQHYLLGQWLRNRYKQFLPDEYSEKQVYVRSTNVDRTLMSAEVNLAGMFPPTDKQIWADNLLWQPIPIHTTPETLDDVLSMKYPCEKYELLLEKLKASPEITKINQNNKQLYTYLSKNTNENITSLSDLLYLYDTLMIENLYNLTLPDWTKSVFPQEIAPWAKFTFAIECYTPELARLKAGPLLNDIIEHFSNSTQDNGYKFIAYSAHDNTVANVLNALQLFEYHCPPYGATILFELRFINNTYFVNMAYKNSTTPQKLVLKNCTFYCPLNKFKEILKPLLLTPEQWREECQVAVVGYYGSYSVIQGGIFVLGFAMLLVLGLCIAIRAVLKMKPPREQDYVRLPSQENTYS